MRAVVIIVIQFDSVFFSYFFLSSGIAPGRFSPQMAVENHYPTHGRCNNYMSSLYSTYYCFKFTQYPVTILLFAADAIFLLKRAVIIYDKITNISNNIVYIPTLLCIYCIYIGTMTFSNENEIAGIFNIYSKMYGYRYFVFYFLFFYQKPLIIGNIN